MSFFRHKRKKIKYETLPPDKKEEPGLVISEGFSVEAVNLFINNFVDPGDDDSAGKLNLGEERKCKSWSVITDKMKEEVIQNSNFKKHLSDLDARKHATFMRLQKKLENIKSFYPDVYYSNESVIDLWAKKNELTKINLELLEYDRDSPSWLWI